MSIASSPSELLLLEHVFASHLSRTFTARPVALLRTATRCRARAVCRAVRSVASKRAPREASIRDVLRRASLTWRPPQNRSAHRFNAVIARRRRPIPKTDSRGRVPPPKSLVARGVPTICFNLDVWYDGNIFARAAREAKKMRKCSFPDFRYSGSVRSSFQIFRVRSENLFVGELVWRGPTCSCSCPTSGGGTGTAPRTRTPASCRR